MRSEPNNSTAPQSPSNHTILVLDANQRAALAVTRSLGSKGLNILCADSTEKALAGASRYCHNYYQCPDISQNPTDFLNWIEQLLATRQIDFVFPITERSSQLLLRHPERIQNTAIPFADLDTILSIGDKGKLAELALSLDLAIPDTQFLDRGEALLALDIEYPAVLKPTVSNHWLGDRWLETTVHIAHNQAEMQKLVGQHDYLRDYPLLLQNFVPGSGAGIFAIYDRGKAVQFFAHQRLREKPPAGGVSVLSQSVEPNPQLLKIAKTLLDGANWHGVAMVEFRVAPDGCAYLMEVNTRFWGSLQLAIDSGVDFPHLLYCISTGSDYTTPTVKTGQKLRWLLGDLDNLYLQWKDANTPLSNKLKALLRFFVPAANTRHEVNRGGDLGPAWLELKRYFGLA